MTGCAYRWNLITEYIEEKQELAKLFGEVAFEEVHKLADKIGWDDGSKEKIILHGLVGGIMAELGGGKFGDGLKSGAVNEAIIKAIGDLPVEYQQLASALVGGAVAKITGGDANTGASVAASGTKNNWQEEDKNKEILNSLVVSEEALQEAKNQISQNEVEYDPNKTFEANMHDILDAGGFIPIIGIAADGTNAILYCYEEEYIQALITVGAAIPLVEYGVAGIKLTKKVEKAEDFVKKFSFDLQLFSKDGSKIQSTVTNGVIKEVAELGSNKIHHILQDKHKWGNVVNNSENWKEISEVISKVMENGIEGSYKGVYSKTLELNGSIVEVTYTRLQNGTIKISDAWVR